MKTLKLLAAVVAGLLVPALAAAESARPRRLDPLIEPQFTPGPADVTGFRLPQAPAALPQAPQGEPGAAMAIRSFRILGVTVFSEAEVQAVAAPYVDRPLTPEDLEELRYRLTRLYVDHGYINSGAILEGRMPVDGVVTYRVVEGRLSEIRVQGTGDLRPDYVRNRIELGAGPPLNTQVLQDRFRLLLQDPLIERLNGALGPGLKPGEAVLDLEVQRAKPYELHLAIDNHRPPSVGEFEGELGGTVRNLTGWGDALSAGINASEGYQDATLGFEVPINARDTRLSLGLEESRSRVIEEGLKELHIEGHYSRASIGLSHPLRQSLTDSLEIAATLSAESSKNWLLGEPWPFSRGEDADGHTRVTTLDLTQTYTRRASDWAWSAQSVLSLGLDALGATTNPDGLPDGRFVAWLGRLQYARRLPQTGGQLLFRGDVQASSSELLPVSRFSVGGADTVRGYRENRLVGDEGYLASIEYRHPLPFSSEEGLPGKLSAVAFYDQGAAWTWGVDDPPTLRSAGVGLRWEPTQRVTIEAAWAHPLNDAEVVNGDAWQDEGVHIRINWDLL